jgi:hypothetical protein
VAEETEDKSEVAGSLSRLLIRLRFGEGEILVGEE